MNETSTEQPTKKPRGLILSVLPIWFILWGGFFLFNTVSSYIHSGKDFSYIVLILQVKAFIFSIIYLVSGCALLARKEFGRMLYLLGIPCALLIWASFVAAGKLEHLVFVLTNLPGYAIFAFLLTRQSVKEALGVPSESSD